MKSGFRADGEAVLALQASQAAVILATLTVGQTTVDGVPASGELAGIIEACRGFGATVRDVADGLGVNGVGIGGLARPPAAVGSLADAFGTALLTGLAGSQETGAPVAIGRAAAPAVATVLAASGASVMPCGDSADVFEIRGARDPLPACHGTLTDPLLAVIALIAGLNAAGTTTVVSDRLLPGALETLLRSFGADVSASADGDTRSYALQGRPELRPARIVILDLIGSAQDPS